LLVIKQRLTPLSVDGTQRRDLRWRATDLRTQVLKHGDRYSLQLVERPTTHLQEADLQRAAEPHIHPVSRQYRSCLALLGKDSTDLWDDGAHALLRERFQRLLQSPGLGVLTGEPGVGKTSVLRALTHTLNPHRYQVVYLSETDFGRLDLYKSLALALGITPPHRRAPLWRELKARILELTDTQQILPIWIVDEAHNLPPEFFRDLPAFLNFAFDSRDLLTLWLVGHPSLAHTLQRVLYAALAGRVQVRIHLKPVLERERFAQFIQHAFKAAGANHTLLADSGLELVRQASQGLPRQAGRILRNAMSLAASKKLNHLPDDILLRVIEELR
jgi:MSHA biogenesis protein MshM